MATNTYQPDQSYMSYQLGQYGVPTRRQPSQSPLGATTSTTSAVMPNGTPAPADMSTGQVSATSGPTTAGPSAPQPATATSPTAAPATTSTPSTNIGLPTLGYTPVQAAPPVTVAPASQGTATMGLPGTVSPQGVYNPTGNVPQFTAPNTSDLQNAQMAQIMQLLGSGGSLNPQVVAQMKGQERDASALMEKQNLGALQSQLASRGIAGNAGYGLGQQRQLQSDATANLLNQYRGTDIAAATQNRQDILNALGLAGNYQNQLFNQASQGFQNNLAGYGMQQSNLQAAAQSLQNAINAGTQNNQFNSQLAQALGIYNNQSANQMGQFNAQMGQNMTLAQLQAFLQQQAQQQQNNQFNSQLAQQNSQFGQSLGFNYAQLNQAQQQFLANMGFNYAQLGQNQNQFNSTLGFNYANLYNGASNSTLSQLLQILGISPTS